MKTHTANYLDSGFYVISDQSAAELCRVLGQPLPKEGHEKFVMLRLVTEGGENYSVNAWMQRTSTSHSVRDDMKNERGWHWSLYSIRRDAGAYLPALGKSFPFVAISSTLATA